MTKWRSERRHSGGSINDRPSRLSILLRRQRRMLGPFIVLIVLLVFGGGAALVLHDATSEKHFAPIRAKLVQYMPLRIRTISIQGRQLTKEDDLMHALGTSVGQPIFGFSVNAARDRINELPFVDHATVERHMPDAIIIKLIERSPIAVWQDRGHFILINRAGERVPDQGLTGKNAEAFVKLPLVVGEGANEAAAPLIDALNAQPIVKNLTVAAVRVGQRRWNLTLHDGTIVLLPEGQELAALARLAQYQQQYKLLERPVISIDMRLPDRMTIHQPPQPKTSPTTGDTPASPPRAKAGETPRE
ncbi:cell division protein FtsQ/DivIB [Kozakia baliensis]|uniref:cell division protein FtsQ/DivIB n=1 Tax=Kozakia baliensis TaxID=153496 RepID=UPI00087BCE3F|nr:FtsQ-type POTRA domain-containing protein [Kozakia baliensis]AOX19615.1 cell division protein FtsQ [Kozakia baliensis]